MEIKEILKKLIAPGLTALVFASAGMWVVDSGRAICRDTEIKLATEKTGRYVKTSSNSYIVPTQRDTDMEIAEINAKYAVRSSRDINNLLLGAGIGALVGLIGYRWVRYEMNKPSSGEDNSDYDDGSNWSRTDGEQHYVH